MHHPEERPRWGGRALHETAEDAGDEETRAEVPLAVSLRNIDVFYGQIQVLHGVDFDLEAGFVHALMGANGAGKSTLAKVIEGIVRPANGVVEVRGVPMQDTTAAAHRARGVSAIHQETTIVPQLSAASNAYLGRRGNSPWRLINRRAEHAELLARCDEFGIAIDPAAQAGTLSIAQQRILEIIRALDAEHSVLLMDEPTGALGADEREHFYELVKVLAQDGAAILYISHDLDEVLALADSISVMRDGDLVASRATAEWTKQQIVRAMLGRDVETMDRPERPISEEITLAVRGLTVPGRVDDVSFDVHRGEILGIAGLVGSGRTEVLRALVGAEPTAAGSLTMDGTNHQLPRTPREALRKGIALAPENRRVEGIVPALSGEKNIVLSDMKSTSRGGVVNKARRRLAAQQTADSMALPRQMVPQKAETLSGGNQQKLVLGRWMFSPPRILLLDEPTIGIDVGAQQEIFDTARRIADTGVSVIVVSAEWEELIEVCDRILVLAQGRIVTSLTHTQATIDAISRAVFEGDAA